MLHQVDAVLEFVDLVLQESADVVPVEVSCQTSCTCEVKVHDPSVHLLRRGSLIHHIIDNKLKDLDLISHLVLKHNNRNA